MGAAAQAHRHLAEALGRLRAAWWPILQTALAAAAAWYIAHDLLGHPQPFFAPIAAAIALGAMARQRGPRALQIILGVCIGIAIGEGLHEWLGTDALSIGVVTFVTMNVAVALGWGFVGQGAVFVNQAAASAILVIALRRSGTGSERIVDALVGGGVALVFSQLLFPPDPLAVMRGAERQALGVLADTFDELVRLLDLGRRVDAPWMLQTSEHLHRQLAAVADARESARRIVRLTRRRGEHRAVEAEVQRAEHLRLLGNSLLSLLRIALGRISAGEDGALPEHEVEAVRLLARAVRLLRSRDDEARGLAARAAETVALAAPSNPREAVVAQLVGVTARDVTRIAGDRPPAAVEALAAPR